jgi:hypothetical protein
VLGPHFLPHILAILSPDLVTAFEPLAQVALGWLALVIGFDFGRTEQRRARVGNILAGLGGGILTGGAVAGAVWFFLTRVKHAPADVEHVILAGGIGAACAETTRHALRWASDRHGAAGTLTSLLADFAHSDDVGPLLAMTVLFSLAPVPLTRVQFQWWGWVAITVGFGVVLGIMTAVHIGRELRVAQTWGVLLGMSLLGLGVGARLGLSIMTVLFFMGWTTAALSRHRAALRTMVAPFERSIVLPALVLAGAHVDFDAMPGLAAIAAVAIVARIAAKLVFGAAVAARHKATPALGAGLLSSGALSVGIGLSFAIRFPGPLGEAVLAVAFVTCIVGEAIGPLALRRALRGAGDIVEPRSPESSSATRAVLP